jgi:hypothetical protein
MIPIQATWRPDIGEGGAFVPLPRFHNAICAEVGAGEVVTLERREERSIASHNHYMATVDDAFDNLPERHAGRWATPDELRYWALIKAGYHNKSDFVCATKAEAPRLAAFLRQINEYAVIVVSDAVVTRYTAKSQSFKAMGRQDFSASKDAVLAILAELVGVDPAQFSTSSQGTGAPNKRVGAAAA